MSDAGIFTDGSKPRPVPHVDLPVDPNAPGEGQRIRDLVEMGRLTTAQVSEIATRINADALLRNARDSKMSPDGKNSVRRGNEDIIALVQAGVFQFNEQALQQIVRQISFNHPRLASGNAYSSKPFVEALVGSNALESDSQLPDVVLSRRDIVSDSANAQFLIECIEAGFFSERPDLLAQIAEKIELARRERDEIAAYKEGNGYWETRMRQIEDPVVATIAELGADVRAFQTPLSL